MSALPKQESDSIVSELPSPKGPGARLKSAREAQSLNLDKVAAQLHLSNEMLRALEADDYDNLPARVFVVGYLRNYARLVGLPAEAITQALDHYLPAEPHQEVELPKVGTSSSAGVFEPAKSKHFPFFKMFMLLGAAIAAFWGWQQGYFTDVLTTTQSLQQQLQPGNLIPSNRQDETPLIPPAENTESDSSALTLPIDPDSSVSTGKEIDEAAASNSEPLDAEAVETVASLPASQPVETAKPAESDVVADTPESAEISIPVSGLEEVSQTEAETPSLPVTESSSPVSDPVSVPGSPEIVLSLTDKCWVNIKDSAGEFRMNNLYNAGTEKKFTGKPPYKILIGNVRAATLTIDGEAFDLSGYTKQNVARLVLDPSTM
jgi:cytoskeleton protein RodZ